MDRVYRQITRDAARAAGAALAHLTLLADREGRRVLVRAATEGPAVAERDARLRLQAALAAGPLPEAAQPVLAGAQPFALVPISEGLAPLLGREGSSRQTLLLPVGEPGHPALLQLLFAQPLRPSQLPALEALGRHVAGRLEAVRLRQEAARRQAQLADLRQAKETLGGLQLAATQLMIEADEGAILAAASRELAQLGLHAGVLLEAPGADADRPRLAWRSTSLPMAQQRAIERILGRPLAAVTIDPADAPLVRQHLEHGRTLVADRPRALARELLGGAAPAALRAFARLLGPVRIVLAPLRLEGRPSGLLAVLAPRMRPGAPEAIEAFALQASIALEKARLLAALREERARLEGEVERRTRELRLAVEALQEKDRQKDNFLANVSHELRTPLVTVLGWSELLSSGRLGPLEERQRQAAQVIRSSGQRLEGFIGELLEFSRHELAGDRLQHEAFDVAEALSQAVLSLGPRLADRRIVARVRAAPGLPRAWADRERVIQVLVNLLANAERHSPPGGRLRLAAARGAAGAVVVSVSDRGDGIPPEHLARIFDRLYQVRDAHAPREGPPGLGLGLAIARSIVEAHGGRIGVRSRVGHGTRFRFSLPSVELVGRRGEAPGGAA